MAEHDNHDSKTNPVPGCDLCAREVYRRSHRCHGDGLGGITIPSES